MASSSRSASRFEERTVRVAVQDARQTWRERTSLILMLSDAEGRVGLGEAAPLPGFSPETLDEARADILSPTPRCPSVQFARACAELDLRGQRERKPIWALLRDDAPAALECNALVTSEPSAWLRDVTNAVADGARTVKLKVGWSDVDAQLRALDALDRALPAHVRLRLDANCSFTPAAAARVREALAPARFEYLEDPVADASTLRSTGIPWASDQLAGPAQVRVVKPTVTGQIAFTGDVVLTHAYEGPIAYAALVHLAFAAGGTRAMGLAPHAVLAAWPNPPPYRWQIPRPTAPGLGRQLDA